MNLTDGDIYGGLTGPQLPVDEFEFGNGISVSRTFAHLMAPFLMAFAPPAEAGQHHPGPLRAAKGGFGFDVVTQLHIPSSFRPADWFDGLNTVWWFAALLRFIATPHIRVPVIADAPFQDGPTMEEIEIIPVEVEHRSLLLAPQEVVELTLKHLEWVRDVWYPTGMLMRTSPEFNTLFQVVDECLFARSPSLALLSLFGAIETVFSPARAELRFRVSSNVSAFLEDPGLPRLKLQKKVAKLYDARSGAVHGSKDTKHEDLLETYVLAKRVITKIIDANHVPSKNELEQRLFGV